MSRLSTDLWPPLLQKIKAALDDTLEPAGSEADDLRAWIDCAYGVAETNNGRISALVIEMALRALYLYATGKDAIPVDPKETDVFDPDFEIDIWKGQINMANLAYKVLFCEKPDQRFLSVAAAWSCSEAARRALIAFLTSNSRGNAGQPLGHLCDPEPWLASIVPGDVLFEKLRNAALESIAPPLLFQFGDVATRIVADYAPEVSTELANQAKALPFMHTPRCVLEMFNHEVHQLCGFDFIRHFVVFENRPKKALLAIKKHRDIAKDRHPPLIIFLNDGSCYIMHESLKLFEHHDIFKSLGLWLESVRHKPILGTLSVQPVYNQIKKIS